MNKNHSGLRGAGRQPNATKLRRLEVKLGNIFVRLAAGDRRKVLHLFDELVWNESGPSSYWDPWSREEMRICCIQLRCISKQMADGWRCWALELFKIGRNDRLAMNCLVDSLIRRRWMEEC